MKIYDVRGIGASLTGSFSGSFKGLFTGPLDGVAATSSYVEYSNVANKPTLVSGSSQVSFSGITNKPTLVSGSSQVLAFNVFATTGSNQFNGNQSVTGSLTVTGQVIAQTLNVQQVTSSIVFSSGSNKFGDNSGNTHRFTGSVSITGSLTVNGSGLVPYTGATQDVNLGVYSIATNGVLANQITVNPSGTTAAQVFLKHGSSFSLPNGFGSIGSSTGNQFRLYQVSSEGVWRGAGISLNSITPSETRVYTLPDASGTIALASSLSAYLPLTGGTLTGALNGTSALFSSTLGIGTATSPSAELQVGKSSDVTIAMSNSSSVTSGARGSLAWYNSSVSTVAIIRAAAVTDNVGTELQFFTRPAAGSLTQSMTLDASGRLGIGNTSPQGLLQIGVNALTNNADASNAFNLKQTSTTAATGIYLERSGERKGYYMYMGGSLDSLTFQRNNAGTKADVMSLTRDGNVGISTDSPNERLQVSGAISATGTATTAFASSSTMDYFSGGTRFISRGGNNSTRGTYTFKLEAANGSLSINPLIITSGGLVGVGIEPSAWDTSVFPDTLQVGNGSISNNGGPFTQFANNIYYDGSNYRYISTGGAQRLIYNTDGTIVFENVASGTGGNTFTFSERMRITPGGHVGIKIVPNSGWGSAMAALQIGTGGVIDNWTGGDSTMSVGVNYYDNGSGSQLRLYAKGASKIGFNENVITFSNVGADSAGSTITWSTRLTVNSDGHVLPGNNGTQNLGSSSLRWATVFTSDLSLSNGIGDYTIVEGEHDLFLYNNKNNKVYKFLVEEVDPSTATPKKS